MALHDVDKSSDDRSAPQPNRHDTQEVPRLAHGTNSVNYVTDATSGSSGPKILGGYDRLVASGIVRHAVPNGNPGHITITTTPIAHGLNFAPSVRAVLNNASINGGGSFNLPLPLPLELGNDTGGVGAASEYLAFVTYMQYAVDSTNFYVITYSSGITTAANYDVTFYLYQQTAQ